MIPIRVSALPPGLPALRDAASAEGFHMLRVLEEDWASGALRFDGPGEALFAVHLEDALAALGGVTRDPYAGEEGTARVRRLYVLPARRGRGVGTALLSAMTGHARGAGCRLLRVRSPASAAGFYERHGFRSDTGARGATHLLTLEGG